MTGTVERFRDPNAIFPLSTASIGTRAIVTEPPVRTNQTNRSSGSGVAHIVGAKRTRRVASTKMLHVTMVLQPINHDAHVHDTAALKRSAVQHPADRTTLTRAQLASLYNPGAARIRVVTAWASAHAFHVVETSAARHAVVLEGSVGAFSRAFGITLHHYRSRNGTYRAHNEPIQLPPALASIVIAVLGLDTIPLHRAHGVARASTAAAASPKSGGLTPAQLERHYAFPTGDASGRRIALLQFAGGFNQADIEAFAKGLGIRLPRITTIGVKGSDGKTASNAPLSPARAATIAAAWKQATSLAALAKQFGADASAFLAMFEVTMDLEIAIAMGGGAAVDVYFAPPGVDGWRRAIYAVLGEHSEAGQGQSAELPTVLSISWGESESAFGPQALRVINDVLVAAERRGVLVCSSSGDRGTSNVYPSPDVTGCGAVNANFPSSSPAVLACGGTTLVRSTKSTPVSEIAWNEPLFTTNLASGGGMSGLFPRPAFQSGVTQLPVAGSWRAPGVPAGFVGRWFPDVAANAAFSSGLAIRIGGVDLAAGGTSAATPLCAALLTRVAATVKHPLAGLTAWLYSLTRQVACRDITVGNNDVCDPHSAFYEAGLGWDACTGWGAPDGALLIAALAAGRPTSPASSPRSNA